FLPVGHAATWIGSRGRPVTGSVASCATAAAACPTPNSTTKPMTTPALRAFRVMGCLFHAAAPAIFAENHTSWLVEARIRTESFDEDGMCKFQLREPRFCHAPTAPDPRHQFRPGSVKSLMAGTGLWRAFQDDGAASVVFPGHLHRSAIMHFSHSGRWAMQV